MTAFDVPVWPISMGGWPHARHLFWLTPHPDLFYSHGWDNSPSPFRGIRGFFDRRKTKILRIIWPGTQGCGSIPEVQEIPGNLGSGKIPEASVPIPKHGHLSPLEAF